MKFFGILVSTALLACSLSGCLGESETEKVARSINEAKVKTQKAAQVSEIILAASPCRTEIAEAYLNGKSAAKANNWGCEKKTDQYDIATNDNGAIYVRVASNHPNREIADHVVTLVPLINDQPAKWTGKPSVVGAWRCGSTQDAPAGAQMIPAASLPSSCRG